ncbi:MAG: FtsX-like permease family protein, partial [Thermoplasmatota archaeon]
WPPSNAELRTIRFEITAARIDEDTNFDYDVIRYPAIPVGLYETYLDALDQFTLFAPIEEVRRLLGYDGDEIVGNVITSEDSAKAAQFAEKRKWTSEDSETFSKRFIGQMVEVVQSLSLLVTVLLFLVPVFLLWYGLTQQLDRQRRELAVCQALGLEERMLRFGLTRLVAKVLLIAGLVLAAALGGYLLLFYGFIQDWDGSPFPLDYLVPWWASVSVAVLIAAGVIGALFWTAKRQHRRDLVATLRAQ